MAIWVVESVNGYWCLVVDKVPGTIVDEGFVVKVVDSVSEFCLARRSSGVSVVCGHILVI